MKIDELKNSSFASLHLVVLLGRAKIGTTFRMMKHTILAIAALLLAPRHTICRRRY